MKAYIETYIKLARGGLFKNAYYGFILVVIFMLAIAPRIGADAESMILLFFPLAVLADLDTKKYVVASSVPIPIHQRIRLLYMNTYILCFLSMVVVHLGYLIIGEVRAISTSIIVFCLVNMGSHLYYAIFCSQEFKEDPQERIKAMLSFSIILTSVIMGLLSLNFYLLKGGLIHYAMIHISIGSKIIVIVIVGILQGVTAHLSFKKVESVARNREVRA